MQRDEQLAGLAIKPLFGSETVRQRTGMHGWIQRVLIGLACLWLGVGVLLPLLEVLERATRLEIPVRIEEPTEQEKAEDSFRGQVGVAGYTILLIEENRQDILYINNRKESGAGFYRSDDLVVEYGRGQLQRVELLGAPVAGGGGERQKIRGLEVARDEQGVWRVDGQRLAAGTQIRVVRRFIGLANFLNYFGLQGMNQWQFLLSGGVSLLALVLLVRILVQWFGTAKERRISGNLLAAAVLLLVAQGIRSAHDLVSHGGHSNLALSVRNSLSVGVSTTVIAVLLAFLYAYGMTRTCIRGKMFFRIIAMLPLFAPTMLYGLSLVYMFGNQGIVTTGFFGRLPWLAWDINLYGFNGVVLAETAFTFPPAMMILTVALMHTDARLYEAARSLGSGWIRTFFSVTLPGVKYGLLSAVFVCFTLSFTDFGAPKVVGGQFNVLAVDIYKQVIGQQNFGMGATVSVILLIPTLLAFVADRIVQRRSHAALGARSVPYTPSPMLWRDLFFTVYCSLVALCILAVLFTAGIASFVKMWPYSFSHPEMYPDVWTLSHYTFEHVGGGGYRAFFTSLRMAAYTAVFGTIITFSGAWLIEKTTGADWLRKGAYLLSIVPLALPGLVIGIAYVFFFNKPTLNLPFTQLQIANPFLFLYGTMAILVLSNIVHFYTVSFLTATTALRQLDKEFEAVSESMAVPFYQTFFRVTVPVCLPAIIEIAAYYFVSAMATVSAVIFLYTSRLPLASVAVVNMDDAGDTAAAAAMCMLIVLANILVRSVAEGLCYGFTRKTRAWRER